MAHLASTLNIRNSLFTTNEAPSEEESNAIDAKLVQLRAEYRQAIIRLSALTTGIARLELLRHPILNVPDDVLGLIFSYATPWCLEDGFKWASFTPPPSRWQASRLATPWRLSHVCRKWRAVCLSLPHLWSAFRTEGLCAEMLDTICQRSEPLLLRLEIGEFPPTSGLMNTSHRWRCVFVTSDCSQDDIFENRAFPYLTQLDLDHNSGIMCTSIVAPRLHILTLRDVDSGLRLPWEQITRYTSVDSSLDFLKDMENLEDITIKEFGEKTEGFHAQGITFSKVRRFRYRGAGCGLYGFNYLIKMFSQCNLASLRTLIVDEDYEDWVPPPLAITLPSVIELSMKFGKADSVRDMLRATPNVQSLHIECVKHHESLVHGRTPGNSSVASLRRLKHFSLSLKLFDRGYNPPAYLATLDKAVAAFKTYELPLETMSFYSGSGWAKEHRPVWLRHVRQGMAKSLDMCTQNGIQVQYYYNTEHNFA